MQIVITITSPTSIHSFLSLVLDKVFKCWKFVKNTHQFILNNLTAQVRHFSFLFFLFNSYIIDPLVLFNKLIFYSQTKIHQIKSDLNFDLTKRLLI
jgi:hypothetical protein